MAGIDEDRQFVPLKFAVLTVSDTRELADDRSGATLAERIKAAGHIVVERNIVHRRRRDDPRARQGMDRRARDRRHHHHRRHRLHRPRRDAGGGRAAVREADGSLRGAVPDGELPQDRHLGDPDPRHRRASPTRPTSSACRARPAPAATPGTKSWCTSSTTATAPATSSRSCRGSTSTCAGRRRKAPPRSSRRRWLGVSPAFTAGFAPGRRHRCAAQHDDAATAETAEQVRFGIGVIGAMAAERIVECLGDQQALVGTRPRAERGGKKRKGFNDHRTRAACASAPEHGRLCAPAKFGILDEAVDLGDPGCVGHRAGPQEHQPMRRALPRRPALSRAPG